MDDYRRTAERPALIAGERASDRFRLAEARWAWRLYG
jgi:hypothetical protein